MPVVGSRVWWSDGVGRIIRSSLGVSNRSGFALDLPGGRSLGIILPVSVFGKFRSFQILRSRSDTGSSRFPLSRIPSLHTGHAGRSSQGGVTTYPLTSVLLYREGMGGLLQPSLSVRRFRTRGRYMGISPCSGNRREGFEPSEPPIGSGGAGHFRQASRNALVVPTPVRAERSTAFSATLRDSLASTASHAPWSLCTALCISTCGRL